MKEQVKRIIEMHDGMNGWHLASVELNTKQIAFVAFDNKEEQKGLVRLNKKGNPASKEEGAEWKKVLDIALEGMTVADRKELLDKMLYNAVPNLIPIEKCLPVNLSERTSKNRYKIKTYANFIQKNCKERCYDAEDIFHIAKDLVRRLTEMGIAKKELAGTRLDFGGGHKMPNSYKYPVMGTIGTIEFNGKGEPILISLKRGYCERNTYLTLSDATKASLVMNISAKFRY